MEEILKRIYFDANHPAGFSSAEKLYKFSKRENSNISLSFVKDWLSAQNVYTLHRQARKNFSRNKIFVSYIDEQWEIDLVDLKHLSRQNNGYSYILNAIDCFSKFLFAVPTKTKTTLEMIGVFKKIFRIRKPVKIRSDKGGEFDSRLFREFCKKNNVIYFTTQNKTIKCAMVERVNRTLKGRIFRYFTHKGTRKYVDILSQLVNGYNKSIHRITKMAPSDVGHDDERDVFKTMYHSRNLLEIMKKKSIKPKFNVGDNVRQKYDISSMEKSYYPMWTDMVYKVNKVYDKLKIPQYEVDIEGEKLKRRFYPEELQKVKINNNTLWLIEKKLKTRERDGVKQVLVKWKGYPPKFNQWINSDQIQDL